MTAGKPHLHCFVVLFTVVYVSLISWGDKNCFFVKKKNSSNAGKISKLTSEFGVWGYTQETGSQLKCYMGESQDPVEAFLDSESSNIFPKDVKSLLLQSPKHYHYWRENTRTCLATEATSATTTAYCFKNQTQLRNTERGLLVLRNIHIFQKTNEAYYRKIT